MNSPLNDKPPLASVCNIRRAIVEDLPPIAALEEKCFPPGIRDGKHTLSRSLKSPHQEVWVSQIGERLCGALFLRMYRRTVRIYSIAVDPTVQKGGVGAALLDWAEQRCCETGASCLSLEVEASRHFLVDWYGRHGFHHVCTLPDYYAPQKDGLRLIKKLSSRKTTATLNCSANH